jgi:uncharacterized protein YjbI with pentapeptide repeats
VNAEHLAILRQGVGEWNTWRTKNPDVRPELNGANLCHTYLYHINFQEANLRGANLRGSNLQEADLQDADLQDADLQGVNFQDGCLIGANLIRSQLTRAFLIGANLQHADLTQANLQEVDFRWAEFGATTLHRATVGGTIFDALDLRGTCGLDTTQHISLSTIGIDTLYRSGGAIPEIFLRGCGVPDSMIEYARSLVAATRPIDYYSCFISYADEDRGLAERLYADLQAKGVRCWCAPHDLEIGESILAGIDRGIRLYDKVLLILSMASVESAWIEQEVNMTLARERNERRRILFPIRIDDSVSAHTAGWPALVWSERYVGDFCAWKEHDAYQTAFQRVLRDLTAKADTPSA